jgi:transcriptional regulator with XRE-family HTH domain
MLGYMGYTDKLQKLCALRGLDQSELASKVGLSKSSMSRILSGAQEPKLRLAYDLAKALGVTLDYLVDEESEVSPFEQRVMVTNDELTILKMVRVLGTEAAMNRLLNAPPGSSQVATDAKVAAQQLGTRPRNETRRGESGID